MVDALKRSVLCEHSECAEFFAEFLYRVHSGVVDDTYSAKRAPRLDVLGHVVKKERLLGFHFRSPQCDFVNERIRLDSPHFTGENALFAKRKVISRDSAIC